jgi:protein-tyrosine phosphatase
MVQRLRSLARRGLNRIEAALHDGRRRRALERVRRRSDATLVFICLGNICRSPFAELWMHRRRPEAAALSTSAGFMPGGRNSPDTAVAVARSVFDLDLTPHVSRSIGDIPDGDRLWVVMEHEHLRRLRRVGIPEDDILILGDLDPEPVDRRAILDPYGRSAEIFEARYRRIERCLTALDDARAG